MYTARGKRYLQEGRQDGRSEGARQRLVVERVLSDVDGELSVGSRPGLESKGEARPRTVSLEQRKAKTKREENSPG